MNGNEATAAVEAWIRAVLPELEDRTYPYVPTGKSKALPDAVIDVGREDVVRDDEDFTILRLQQVAAVRIFRMGVSIMVEAGTTDADAGAAQTTLRSFIDRLLSGILQDDTLGARVDQASPFVEVDYTPPFVEYEDGTRGREVTLNFAIGEALMIED